MANLGVATEGADILIGSERDDRLLGGGGNDIIEGGSGPDHLEGGAGRDVLLGGSGYDVIGGGAGRDVLRGGSGGDILSGGADRDFLRGDTGADALHGVLAGGGLVYREAMSLNTPSPTFPAIALPQFENERLPPVMPVALRHPDVPALPDVASATRAALDESRQLTALTPGARVAITCGSRGIRSKPAVVRAAAAWLRERGLAPFIVPAMGSHGGAVAEGQVSLLAELGFTEEAMGCPIRASMEVVRLGKTGAGIPVHFDRHAFEADAVLVVGRVKSHTSFDREVESGLTKMTAIGLGKAEGARFVHRLGVRGYMEVLPEWAAIAIREAPVAYGIAIVENAAREAATIEGVEPEDFYETDARLLKTAKGCVPKLPFEQIDVLAVEQLGKNISGTGMDPAVTARFDIRGRPNPPAPVITKLVVLGLTPETHGNGLGVGNADYTTKAVADSLDLYAMYMNACTATFTERVRIPAVLASDKAALQAAVGTSWHLDGADARLCLIRSTLHLETILVSPPLAEELNGAGEVLGEAEALRFDDEGRLLTRCPV